MLDGVGQGVFVVGDQAWIANAVKLAGNFLIIAAIEAMAEAFILVRKAGVEAERFLEIINGALFKSPIYQNYGMIIAEERYEPAGFKLRLGLKDVNLMREAATTWALRCRLPICCEINLPRRSSAGWATSIGPGWAV